MKSKITYHYNDTKFELYNDNDNEHSHISVTTVEDSTRLTSTIVANEDIELDSIEFVKDFSFTNSMKLFLNGYQSWTDSHEISYNSTMKGISFPGKLIANKFSLKSYGDYNFTRYPDIHGFTYGYARNNDQYDLFGSICESSGFTVIYFYPHNNRILIKKDCKGTVLKKGESFTAMDIVFLHGNEDEVFDQYFSLQGIAPKNKQNLTGYTSWYRHYQNINQSVINEDLKALASGEFNSDVFQVDDGWQCYVGDWLNVDSSKFASGMKSVAENIKSQNLIPGLWLAPFACETKSGVARNHPDWLVKDKKGNPICCGNNWGGFYAIDFCLDEVKDYLRKVFDTVLNEWGYGLVKLDFLYAACIVPRNGKNRGQLMHEAMTFLREIVGDKLILGCGVPLGSAFGLVDYCRIGCDVGLDWDDKPYMRLLHRERISTKNTILNTIYRRQLDGRAFLNDPDVFLMRDNDISLTSSQKKILTTVNCLFGSLRFTSDNISSYDDMTKEYVLNALNINKGSISNISVENVYNNIIISYVLNGTRHHFTFNYKTGMIVK